MAIPYTVLGIPWKALPSNAQSGYNFIEEQAEQARQRLFESEKALVEFKEQEMVISFEEENAINIRKLARAEDEFQEIQIWISRNL